MPLLIDQLETDVNLTDFLDLVDRVATEPLTDLHPDPQVQDLLKNTAKYLDEHPGPLDPELADELEQELFALEA